MADARASAGRLIAIDGSRGRDVSRAAAALAEALAARGLACVVSRWDASGLFNELALAGAEAEAPSPRTVTLAYVADLAFRLRWEIQPALAAGGIVIAAPYVDTAVAWGAACGLPARWLHEVLRTAPAPDVRALADEGKPKKGWKPKMDRGYPEYGAVCARGALARFDDTRARAAMMARLARGRTRGVWRLTPEGVDAAAAAIASRR